MTNLIGRTLGRYHILEQLGEGGMAVVYKAYDTRLETEVAVKIIRTESLPQNAVERALKRFEREAKALARLTHPNIVKVTDYGEFEDKPFLVMPYLPGGTLKQKMGKPIPWQDAIQLLIPIVEALDYAHSQNMVHRDVKPSNILLTQRGQPMLTDFGIAKVLDLEDTQDLTGSSAAVGTPEYMAPEQAIAKTVDHRADIYALGIVLYEMITGKKPYSADTPMAVLIMHARDPLPNPHKLVPNLPDGVEKVLLKALAKKPEDRYQSMDEMVKGFERLPGSNKRSADKVDPSRQRISSKPASGFTFSLKIFVMGILGLALLTFGAIFGLRPLFSEPVLIPAPTNTEIFTTFTPAPPGKTQTATITPTNFFTITPVPQPAEITDDKGVQMVFVPEGAVVLGADPLEACQNSTVNWCEEYIKNNPLHNVFVEAYYMDKFEVSNSLYKECVRSRECNAPTDTVLASVQYYDEPDYEDYPVVWVTLEMAKHYCQWRGARLPTSSEWEKAARGTDGRMYPWGDTLGETPLANFCDLGASCWSSGRKWNINDGYVLTSPVDSFPEGISPYGIYNMAGNVSEWISDGATGTWVTGDTMGGSWFVLDEFLKVYWKFSSHNAYGYDQGFRCARSTYP